MSDRITSAIYKWVVDEVMVKCKPEFVTEGVDESVIVQLRSLWEAKLISTGLVVDPATSPAPALVPAASTPVFQDYGCNASVKPEQGAWPQASAHQQQMTHPSQGVAAALGYAQHMAAGQQQQLQSNLQEQHQAANLQAQQQMQQQQPLAMQQLAARFQMPKTGGHIVPSPLNQSHHMRDLVPANTSSESDASRKRKQPDLPSSLNQGTACGSGLIPSPSPIQQQQCVQQQLLQLQQLHQQQLQQSDAQYWVQQGLAWPNPVAMVPTTAHLTNPAMPLLQQQQFQPQPNLSNESSGTLPPGAGSSNLGVISQHDGPGDVPRVGGAGPSQPSAPRKAAAQAASGFSSTGSKATLDAPAAGAASAAAEEEGTEELLSSDDEGSVEEEEVGNFLCGQFEKVTKAKHKWKITMKDGVFHVEGKDYLFKQGTAEFVWTG